MARTRRQAETRRASAHERLQAVYTRSRAWVNSPTRASARDQLQRILSQPRYSGLRAGPSLLEQILSFLVHRIADFLSWAGVGNLRLNVPIWVWLGLGLAVVILIVVWLMRGVLGRGGREARVRADRSPGRPHLDLFADADRLAAGHDYAAAIRALAGAVSVRLRGEQAWEHSPFTVRELFQQSDRAEGLRPLLLSFEEASYGHRTPDAATYARAAEAAAPYRQAA